MYSDQAKRDAAKASAEMIAALEADRDRLRDVIEALRSHVLDDPTRFRDLALRLLAPSQAEAAAMIEER